MPKKMLYKAAVVGASVAAATALMTPAASAQTNFPLRYHTASQTPQAGSLSISAESSL